VNTVRAPDVTANVFETTRVPAAFTRMQRTSDGALVMATRA
jgi:hypothetical protein